MLFVSLLRIQEFARKTGKMRKLKFQIEGTEYAKAQVRNKAGFMKSTGRGQIEGLWCSFHGVWIFPVEEGSH